MKEAIPFQFEQESSLSVDDINQMYNAYINPGLSKIYQFFSFGKEIFTKAEGMYMFTRENKKILDMTGGLGVLNHGHNHPKILQARIKFQQEKRLLKRWQVNGLQKEWIDLHLIQKK